MGGMSMQQQQQQMQQMQQEPDLEKLLISKSTNM